MSPLGDVTAVISFTVISVMGFNGSYPQKQHGPEEKRQGRKDRESEFH
jgi:hypothetical protein